MPFPGLFWSPKRVRAIRIPIVLTHSVQLGWKAPLRVLVGDQPDVEAMHVEIGRGLLPQAVAQLVEHVEQPEMTAVEIRAAAIAFRLEARLAAVATDGDDTGFPNSGLAMP